MGSVTYKIFNQSTFSNNVELNLRDICTIIYKYDTLEMWRYGKGHKNVI
jgi:hypothetical protein